jgi:hypothetical protein
MKSATLKDLSWVIVQLVLLAALLLMPAFGLLPFLVPLRPLGLLVCFAGLVCRAWRPGNCRRGARSRRCLHHARERRCSRAACIAASGIRFTAAFSSGPSAWRSRRRAACISCCSDCFGPSSTPKPRMKNGCLLKNSAATLSMPPARRVSFPFNSRSYGDETTRHVSRRIAFCLLTIIARQTGVHSAMGAD